MEDSLHSLQQIIYVEHLIKKEKEKGNKILFHSGNVDLNEFLKYGIAPQFGEWLEEVLSGAVDDDELFKTIKNDEHNQVSFFSEEPNWVSMKTSRTFKKNKNVGEMTIKDIMEKGQLCIISVDKEDDEYTFKKAGCRDDPYVEKSTYLFSNEIADYEVPFGVERGDIYSHDLVEPKITLTGLTLVGFLARNYPKANLMKENIKNIFETHPEFRFKDYLLEKQIRHFENREKEDRHNQKNKPKNF